VVVDNFAFYFERFGLIILLPIQKDIAISHTPSVQTLFVPSKAKIVTCCNIIDCLRYLYFHWCFNIRTLINIFLLLLFYSFIICVYCLKFTLLWGLVFLFTFHLFWLFRLICGLVCIGFNLWFICNFIRLFFWFFFLLLNLYLLIFWNILVVFS
jgi:hypothetical protein